MGVQGRRGRAERQSTCKQGRRALAGRRGLQEMGLAFDEWDLDYYTAMFRDELRRDPTNVELFDIAQSNSEHSRWAGWAGRAGRAGCWRRDPAVGRGRLGVNGAGAEACGEALRSLAPLVALRPGPVQGWVSQAAQPTCLPFPPFPPRPCPRHWFFKADLFIDGQAAPENLMDIVKSTLTANPGNSVIGFKDNSSAIRCARHHCRQQ